MVIGYDGANATYRDSEIAFMQLIRLTFNLYFLHLNKLRFIGAKLQIISEKEACFRLFFQKC